mgnify:CR=1 FL=1
MGIEKAACPRRESRCVRCYAVLLVSIGSGSDTASDGELTERMLHPSREVEKVYLARVSNQVTPEEARRLENGVMVDGRRTARAKVKLLSVKPLYTDMLVTIHEGRNRQVRKMVEQVGHQVVLLRRIRFGPLRLGDLPRGMWRELTPEELATLKAL